MSQTMSLCGAPTSRATEELQPAVTTSAPTDRTLSSLSKSAAARCRPPPRTLRRLKRTGKHLKKVPKVVWKFDLQEAVDHMDIFTDVDWAGCRRKTFLMQVNK